MSYSLYFYNRFPCQTLTFFGTAIVSGTPAIMQQARDNKIKYALRFKTPDVQASDQRSLGSRNIIIH